MRTGNITFANTDYIALVDVECKNKDCKYHSGTTNICALFKIILNERGQCASFEAKCKGSCDGCHEKKIILSKINVNE